jgi:gag-polyprotein putative aspartyl protease
MPSLSGQFNPNIGVLLNINVLPHGLYRPGTTLPSSIPSFLALIDTGASMTCISRQVVQAVGLQSAGMVQMLSATQTVPVHRYLVDLLLPFGSAGLLQQGIYVMEFQVAGTHPFQMLLGRDILCQGVFTMSLDGHFTFSL